MLAVKNLLRHLFLLLGVFVIPSLETDDCPPITQGEGSPIYPQATRGESTTMYRVFHTESNVMELNITWTRLPSPLDHSISNFSNHTVFSNSSLNASLTMRDLKVYPDYGNYNVRVCSNCTCVNTTFILYLFNCTPENLPQPVQKYQRTVIAETALEATQWLYTAFVGPPGSFYYPTTWSRGGKDVCDEGDLNKSHPFNCDRTAYGNCSFTANLYIRNPTYKDSGNYTVEAVGQGNSSRAMYELDVVRKPSIICTQHRIVLGGKIDCTIHNYSAFIDVVVVKSDVTEFEKYPASQKCRPIVLDPVTAKCSIKFEDLGRFSVCVNYSSTVITNETLHECTDHIHVETIFIKYMPFWIALFVVAPLSLILVAVIGCRSYRYIKKRKNKNKSAEHDPLLHPNPDTQGGDVFTDAPNRSSCSLPASTTAAGSSRQNISGHISPTNNGASTLSTTPNTPRKKKVLLIYPKNPGEYEQIKPPDNMTAARKEAYEREVIDHEGDQEKRIKLHEESVERFAGFLQSLDITVAYEKQLDDQHVQSKLKWLIENVEKSDFVVLMITPSLNQLLTKEDIPENETFFKGETLSNMIHGYVNKSDGSRIKFVGVFLNTPKCLNNVPSGIAASNSYDVFEPFELKDGRRDNLATFISLVTNA